MKFKGTFTEKGVHSLSKAFLPTLEKFGKSCHLLLSPSEISLVQTPLEADGASVSVTFAPDVLFQQNTLKLQSRHLNLIAFAVDVALLLKALRSAASNDAETVEVKLTQKAVIVPGSHDAENKPFLCFTAKGTSLSLVQDLPIGKPCTPREIDDLVAARTVTSLCPFYLDLSSAGPRLTAVVDRLKALSSVVQTATCKNGDLHIQVAESSVMLGAQFTGLGVLPTDAKSDNQISRQLTAEEQLHDQLEAGEAAAVHVQVKHLLKVINVSQLSQPEQIIYGIAEGGGHVHVMYVYRNPAADANYDESINLQFKLPVRDED